MHDDKLKTDVSNLTVRVCYKGLNLKHQVKDIFYS